MSISDVYNASLKYYCGKNKVSNIITWKNRKSNEMKREFINKMIDRAVFELNISRSSQKRSLIISKLYNRNFETNKLLSILNADFDLFSKDVNVTKKSIEFSLKAISDLGLPISDLDKFQIYGICLLFQTILCGFRCDDSDIGFGNAEDLIYLRKKSQEKKKKNVVKASDCKVLCTVEDEDDDVAFEEEKIVNDNIPESWDI